MISVIIASWKEQETIGRCIKSIADSKYSGISLPGNTQLNGDKILAQAETDLEKLQKEVEQYSSNPSPFWVSING